MHPNGTLSYMCTARALYPSSSISQIGSPIYTIWAYICNIIWLYEVFNTKTLHKLKFHPPAWKEMYGNARSVIKVLVKIWPMSI